MRVLSSLFAICLLVVPVGADFKPTPTPVSPDGVKAVVDVPADQHIKNTGGSDGPRGPGSGSGLCVFSSIELAARWSNTRELYGFQNWMRYRPGGGYPQKVDAMIAAYVKEKGTPAPFYIQHTRGDASFLELALKTGRMPCVTYAGKDDFYRGLIYHMTNLAHLDSERAAIIDNNRTKVWVWMSRQEFLSRWRDADGGWAVVLLDSPPPPHTPAKKEFPVYGQDCPDGRCPLPAPAGPPPVGTAPSPDHYWGKFDNGTWGWRLKPKDQFQVGDNENNYGIIPHRKGDYPAYAINGVPCTPKEVRAAFGAGGPLTDDSDRWHLTVVGDEKFCSTVKNHYEKLKPETKARLHFQDYRPGDWPVGLYSLAPGVSLRKPALNRIGEEAGVIPVGDYTLDQLLDLILLIDGLSKPKPDPAPTPDPVPVPAPPTTPSNWLVLLALAVLGYLVWKQKKEPK